MRWIVRAALSSLLFAGVSATGTLAEPETCVADDEAPTCVVTLPTDRTTDAPDQDVAPALDQDVAAAPVEGAGAPVAPADQPAMTTRTIGPPVVVQPFLTHAAPAAGQTEVVTPRIGPVDPPKLPPGPPNRFP